MSAMSIAVITKPSWRRLYGWAGAVLLSCSVSASASAQTPPDQILLKDYLPRSIFHVPETRVEKARYPILDMHSHDYAQSNQRWLDERLEMASLECAGRPPA
jgi:hypothetical protein